MDEELVGGTPEELKGELIEILDEDVVRHRISDLVRYASDASPYRYIPKVIAQPKNIDHIAAIFRNCIRKGRHATFRAGGTSLNGQSQGDDILIDVRQHWSGWKVEDNGERIRCNVGTTLGRINEVLKPYARRMGPDPASFNAATIGGVLANNAGGMRCRPLIDSYHSIVAMKIVLTTGTIIDTEDPHAEERFAASEPEIAAGLLKIREEILADKELSARIVRKYGIRLWELHQRNQKDNQCLTDRSFRTASFAGLAAAGCHTRLIIANRQRSTLAAEYCATMRGT